MKRLLVILSVAVLFFTTGCDGGSKSNDDEFGELLEFNEFAISEIDKTFVVVNKIELKKQPQYDYTVTAYLFESDPIHNSYFDYTKNYIEKTEELKNNQYRFNNLLSNQSYDIFIVGQCGTYTTVKMLYARTIPEDETAVSIVASSVPTSSQAYSYLTDKNFHKQAVINNLNFYNTGSWDTKLEWSSSNPSIIDNTGIVTRDFDDHTVTLTVKVTKGSAEKIVMFDVKVLGYICNYQFEDDLEIAAWTNNSSTTLTISSNQFVTGTSSLEINGSTQGFNEGSQVLFSMTQPALISFNVRSVSDIRSNMTFTIIGKNHVRAEETIDAFKFNLLSYDLNYATDKWYFVEFKNINWQTKTYDIYVDNIIYQKDKTFPEDIVFVNKIDIENSRSYWDDIIIY